MRLRLSEDRRWGHWKGSPDGDLYTAYDPGDSQCCRGLDIAIPR